MIKERVSLIFFVVLIGFASAAITLNAPAEVYNLGDRLYVSASGIVGADSGNLNIDLICGNQTINLVKISARSFDADDEQTYSIPYKILNKEDLEISDVSKIIGSCRVFANLNGQSAFTEVFTISDDVTVFAELDNTGYDPSENIQLTIKANRADGQPFSGFFQISNATEISGVIEDGVNTQIFTLPSNTKAGVYELKITAYDNDLNGILNSGENSIKFIINQVPTSIVSSISEVEVTPETELTFGADVLDQTGDKIKGSVSLEVIPSKGNVSNLEFDSGEFTDFLFSADASPGVWKAIFSFGDLKSEKEFTMLEFQKAEFEILDSILTIKNVGNAPYTKLVEIKIGDAIQTLNELKIGVGESKQFRLRAPDGEYEIIVSDGENSINTLSLLTGRAVSIKDLENVGIFTGYSVIWIFLILVLGATGLVLFLRHRSTRTIGVKNQNSGFFGKIKNFFGNLFHRSKNVVASTKYGSGVSNSLLFTNKSPAVQSLDSTQHRSEDESMVDLTNMGTSDAEYAQVLSGQKHRSAVISVSIRNAEDLSDHAKEELSKIINKSKISKGVVDWKGSHIFVIFSPVVTRTYGNEMLASRAALKMYEDFNEYNRKFKDKIDFNLGVHAGELVSSKENNRLKYTGIGNTIALAKRMADSDNGKMIVSEEIRKKMLRDMRAIKSHEINKHQTYSVTGIRNKDADKARLKDLLDRMEK